MRKNFMGYPVRLKQVPLRQTKLNSMIAERIGNHGAYFLLFPVSHILANRRFQPIGQFENQGLVR